MPKPYIAGDQALAADLNADFKFGGTGADGAKTISADENLDAGNAAYVLKNYTNLTIDVTKTWTLINPATAGTLLHIKIQGDLVWNGTITLANGGANGGGGGAANNGDGPGGTGTDGTQGTGGWNDVSVKNGGRGGLGLTNKGGSGGGGGGSKLAGTTGAVAPNGGAAAGAGGNALTAYDVFTALRSKGIFVSAGAGGGGGAGGSFNGGTSGAGGAGGKGGGGIIIEVCGDVTFGASAVINLSAQTGTAGSYGSNGAGGGGGGGGAGGTGHIIYNGTLTDGGLTKTVTKGSGGAGGGASGSYTGGAGGDGADGEVLVTKNTEIS